MLMSSKHFSTSLAGTTYVEDEKEDLACKKKHITCVKSEPRQHTSKFTKRDIYSLSPGIEREIGNKEN